MPPSDEELLDRQASLQAEASLLLDDLDLANRLHPAGPLLFAGSYVSGLMCWRDLDVMACVGPSFTPRDVLRLLDALVDVTGLVGFAFHDQRVPRSPAGEVRDERYHLPLTVERDSGSWRVDLTLWLNDPHENIACWHDTLRESITDEQRLAILRIKDVGHRLPSYPDEVGGMEIYAAVLEHGARTPDQFGAWLRSSALEAVASEP
jgi:hypothetical protein